MQNNRKISLLFTVVGGLLIMAALLLTCYNIWDGKRAQKAAEHVLTELKERIVQENERLKKENAEGQNQEQTNENGLNHEFGENQEMAVIAILLL